jgi:hypothetical protein
MLHPPPSSTAGCSVETHAPLAQTRPGAQSVVSVQVLPQAPSVRQA